MTHPGLVVLFEDASMIALDKPAGLHSAPLRAGESETLLARVIERYPEVAALPGVKPVEPGLVHRLDRDTSGIVLVARTPPAFAALREQFNAGEARKDYRAICRGAADVKAGTHLEIRSRFAAFGPGRRMVRVVLPETKGGRVNREAPLTVYFTEARIEAREGERVLLSVELRVGFRHQVRAHLSHLGFPIYGDPLYGVPSPPGAPARMYLHACGISLRHPLTGEPMRLESPLPEEFRALMLASPGQIR
jgi:23S rRNA pseudouridine1911/1915/1917 synthase